jgi:hypothetical protein
LPKNTKAPTSVKKKNPNLPENPTQVGTPERRLGSPGSWWRVAVVGYWVGFFGFFFLSHFKSIAWASGVVTHKEFLNYWNWLAHYLFSKDFFLSSSKSETLWHFAWLILILASLVGFYLYFLRLSEKSGRASPLTLRVQLLLAGSVSVLLFFLPYIWSSDIYSYISFARLFAIYGENPYFSTASKHPDDMSYSWLYWKDVTMPYGPVWLYLSGLLVLVVNLFGGPMVAYLAVFRLLAAGLHLLNGFLIWRIVSRASPERASLATACYLLNPLLLIEFAGNGHNEVLVITFILVGVSFHEKEKKYYAIAMYMLAALVKIYVLPLVAFYGLAQMRTQPSLTRALVVGVKLGAPAALFLLLYWPVWGGLATPTAGWENTRFFNSMAEVVYYLLFSNNPVYFTAIRQSFRFAFLVVVIWLLLRTRKMEDVLPSFAWCILALCSVGATWFWPWYVSIAVAVAAVSHSRRALLSAICLSVLVFPVYMVKALYILGDFPLIKDLTPVRSLVYFLPFFWVTLRPPRYFLDMVSTREENSSPQ